jgi:hypothetical protein
MSAPNLNVDEVLSGQWTDVSIVENLGATDETETFLTNTTADITVSSDYNEWTAEPNSNRYEQSGVTHVRREIEVPLLQKVDTDLETAGLFDSGTDDEIFNKIHEAVRLYVFAEREDADGEEIVQREAERVRIQLDEETFPSDAATATLTMVVMGEYNREFTTA